MKNNRKKVISECYVFDNENDDKSRQMDDKLYGIILRELVCNFFKFWGMVFQLKIFMLCSENLGQNK